MSGQRIDDHSFWAGGKSKGSVFPEGAKTKMESSATGAGHLEGYPDTTELVKRDQEHGVSKAEGRKLKPGYRN